MSDKYKFSEIWKAIRKLQNPYPKDAFTLKIKPSNLSVDRELKKALYNEICQSSVLYELWKKGGFTLEIEPISSNDNFDLFLKHKDLNYNVWDEELLKNNTEYSENDILQDCENVWMKPDELFSTIMEEIYWSDDSSDDGSDDNQDSSDDDSDGGSLDEGPIIER